MGSLLVVGSVAFDTVRTPFGEATEVLGGSATYFSTAASFFTDVELIAVVGEDFPESHIDFLKSRG
ncbi:MAG: sugar kinase, partial [Nitrospirae bacterium]|nr:sugar kinase [Nitrospirota bacterium]